MTEEENPLDVVLRLALTSQLYRSSDGQLHARVEVGDRDETFALKSAGFRNWLTNSYFAEIGKPPSHWAIQRVIAVLEARAWFDGGTPSVSIRVARDPGGDDSTCYLDLGDPSGRAVWICAEGWVLIDKPDVHFRRPDGLLPLPTPSTDGSIELLRQYVNLTDADFRLLVAWVTAALRPVGPYPILVLYGEQGCAKSTLAKIVRLLIDPQDCPLLAEPGTTRDLMATAVNGWLLSYDNISSISASLSDSFCRLVTGGGIATRALYSNSERSVIFAQRPIILNGIEEFVVRGDLIDRCVFLYLLTILPPSRRGEHAFWKAFRADYPRILGGLLDAMVGGLRELPSIHLPELPRMADFAQWGEAVGRGLGWAPGTFLSTYSSNRRQATVPALLDSPVASALVQIAEQFDEREWQGCAPTELFAQVTRHAERAATHAVRHLSAAQARKVLVAGAARWPKDAQTFSKELRRVAPQLRLHGLSIDFERTNQGRRVSFTFTGGRASELFAPTGP